MYSMAAFGPVLGFLLGAYLLSFHMDSLSSNIISIGKIFNSTDEPQFQTIFIYSDYFEKINFIPTDPTDHRWVGMWWGGFLICGLLLILIAIPFFSFPKTLQREKEKIKILEQNKSAMNKDKEQSKEHKLIDDSGYGKDVKGNIMKYV